MLDARYTLRARSANPLSGGREPPEPPRAQGAHAPRSGRPLVITALKPPARRLLMLLLLCAFLFFYRLGDRDLTSSHEARAAQDAQAILATGDWTLPRLLDGKLELQ